MWGVCPPGSLKENKRDDDWQWIVKNFVPKDKVEKLRDEINEAYEDTHCECTYSCSGRFFLLAQMANKMLKTTKDKMTHTKHIPDVCQCYMYTTCTQTRRNKTQQNKWVQEKMEELSGLLEELCDRYDDNLNFEYQADSFLAKLQDAITQTQQETLEWCEREFSNRARDMLYIELGLNAKQVLKGMTYFRKWIGQTIKQRKEEL